MDLANGMTLIVGTLLVMAIAYRYYSAFMAAKVFALDDARVTPAHRLKDGQNYTPTNKWVLFGHHFAAISGAGPLIGPVLAAQFGFMPGFLWILIGVCLAGAVQDFTILVFSTRRNGKSLAQLAYAEIGKPAGTAATIGILFVLVIALAGLGKVVTQALGGGTTTYEPRTKFQGVLSINSHIYQTPPSYTIGEGTEITLPDGTTQTVGGQFEITAEPKDPSNPFDLNKPPVTVELPVKPGTKLYVPRDMTASGTMGGEAVVLAGGSKVLSPSKAIVKDTTKTPTQYLVPKGAIISPISGAQQYVTADFVLTPQARAGNATVDLEVKTETAKATVLEVPEGTVATVTRAISGSVWGTFTIALTIPIALFVGWYIYRVRKGKVLEGSIIGAVLILVAVWAGGAEGSGLDALRANFNLTTTQVGVAMAIYGFIASILPVWILLCPRDYLSSFLKIGTVILLVVGIIFAHPHLQALAFNTVFSGGGPIIKGQVFPFVFITIMCGAISGFHALVSSGTTPKMVDKEKQTRMIGYGAMLIEGLVGIIALIAAASLPSSYYYNMNTSAKELPTWQGKIVEMEKGDVPDAGQTEAPKLSTMEQAVGENLQSRTGGAVTLAVGMARIFETAARNLSAPVGWLKDMTKYWYHFAIMFEALFILTTIDTGTRVGRFLLQETMGKVVPSLGKADNWVSAILSTGIIVGAWWYFLEAHAMNAIWPMFGVANQMLAVMALAIGTAGLVHMGKRKYAWVTGLPMVFVLITTGTAAVEMLSAPMAWSKTQTDAVIGVSCIGVIVVCTLVVVVTAILSFGRAGPTLPEEVDRVEVAPGMVVDA